MYGFEVFQNCFDLEKQRRLVAVAEDRFLL